jgi:cytochrome c553
MLEVAQMNICGLIKVLACLAMVLVLFSRWDDGPLSIYSAEAGAGPEAGGGGQKTKKTALKPRLLVHKEFLDICGTCHKPDGRGGRSYGGYAANLHETELEKDGLVLIITHGRVDMGMPAFDGIIGSRTIDAVARYIIDNFKGVPLDAAVAGHAGNPDLINVETEDLGDQ